MDVKPFVSVIMPVRNEVDFIETSLGAVLAQNYPHDRMEVLIVDGMSTDGTRDIVQHTSASKDIPVFVLDNPKHIVPNGLNIALEQAKGDIIVRVDGHCRIAPDYVSRCVAHLQQKDIAGVGGAIVTIASTTVGQAIAAAMSSSFGVGGSAFRTIKDKTMVVDTVPFPAYTREAIELAGPFDEDLRRNQDDEYNYRLRKLGQTILLAADVHSEYFSRVSLGRLWRQYYQYGMYKVRVMQKHPAQMRPRQFVPLLLVLALIGGALLAPFSQLFRGLWLATLVLYILVNLTTSTLIARQHDWSLLPWLPITFVILHIAYGLGFMIGLIRW